MRSSRQNKKEEVKVMPSSSEESSGHAKNKVTPKKGAKVAQVKEVEEEDDKSDKENTINSPVASPEGSQARKLVASVTPQKAVALNNAKSPKNAFGRKTAANEIEGETPVKKAPVEVSPLVELVYRYN
jgi:hypothetical protein